MKMKHTLLFYISFLIFTSFVYAQETAPQDTIAKPIPFELRIGIDLSKPVRSLVEDDYTGFEIMGDFRFSEHFYLAAEIGNDKHTLTETNLVNTTEGSYFKIGADYNAYTNWAGMNNAIYAGLRYGFSNFSQELVAYTLYTSTPVFPPTIRDAQINYSGLNAHWAEFIFGVKTELIHNIYITLNVQLKYSLSEKKPENFDNLYIPGFNRTYDFSEFGVGFAYGISYLIPFHK